MKTGRFLAILLLPLVAVALTGMAKKPKITVRFHVEANPEDRPPFAMEVKFQHGGRKGYMQTIPFVSEQDIQAIYPFRASDGTMGCAFQLNRTGTNNLEIVSSANQGKTIVAFVGTQKGMHQVTDMVIDKRVSDGVITIHGGLTDAEVAALTKQFNVLGQTEPKKP
jgi:hypothetical protein